MAEITIVEADFICGCGYEVFGLTDLDGEIVCPNCGAVYELVYYLVPDDESEG